MPVYEYRCAKCGEKFELQRSSDGFCSTVKACTYKLLKQESLTRNTHDGCRYTGLAAIANGLVR